MKKNKVISITLFLLTLTLSSCSNTEIKEAVSKPNVISRDKGRLKIAFYNQDTLKLKFEYYKREDSIVTKKQLAFQKQIEKKRKEMESYYMSYMSKAQNNLLSQIEAETYQRNLQSQEADLIKFQETEGAKLEKETIKKLETIGSKIEKFSKAFCEENKIDILMIQANGGQFNYINPEMDVTKEFIEYLNSKQSEIEKDLK